MAYGNGDLLANLRCPTAIANDLIDPKSLLNGAGAALSSQIRNSRTVLSGFSTLGALGQFNGDLIVHVFGLHFVLGNFIVKTFLFVDWFAIIFDSLDRLSDRYIPLSSSGNDDIVAFLDVLKSSWNDLSHLFGNALGDLSADTSGRHTTTLLKIGTAGASTTLITNGLLDL